MFRRVGRDAVADPGGVRSNPLFYWLMPGLSKTSPENDIPGFKIFPREHAPDPPRLYQIQTPCNKILDQTQYMRGHTLLALDQFHTYISVYFLWMSAEILEVFDEEKPSIEFPSATQVCSSGAGRLILYQVSSGIFLVILSSSVGLKTNCCLETYTHSSLLFFSWHFREMGLVSMVSIITSHNKIVIGEDIFI